MSDAVEFRGISKQFAEVTALDDVDLSVVEGSATAIVGESGCGKSTLLQLINGLLTPSDGQLRVFGERVPEGAQLVPFRRRIGYAVQGVGLFPHLPLFENVTLLARLEGHDHAAIQARFEQLCELLELSVELATRFPAQLSGGQQQRAGICRALMLKPPLVLLDEPFSAVDPITRREIHLQFDKARRAEGSTVLLVTHDITEARRLADDLVIMRAGRIEQAGPLTQVLDKPATDYVARLLSETL